ATDRHCHDEHKPYYAKSAPHITLHSFGAAGCLAFMRLDGSTLVLVYMLEYDIRLQTFLHMSASGTHPVLFADNASRLCAVSMLPMATNPAFLQGVTWPARVALFLSSHAMCLSTRGGLER